MAKVYAILLLSLFLGTVTNARPLTTVEAKRLIATQKKQIWHDIKDPTFYNLNENSPLARKITDYHRIDKTDRKKTSERIKALKMIAEDSVRLMEKGEAKNIYLRLLLETASRKANFLERLLTLRDEAFKRATRIINTQNGKDTGRGVEKDALENENFYHLDPGHRDVEYLREKRREWEELLKSDPQAPDFYFWLEAQEPAKRWKGSLERRSRPQEQFFEDRLIIFDKEGYAYSRDTMFRKVDGKTLIHNGLTFYRLSKARNNIEYNYNIDPMGRMYVLLYGLRPYHSDVLHGKTLLSAGIVKFQSGKISYIDNDSGHYQPSAWDLQRAMNAMQSYYKNKAIFSGLQKYGINQGSGVERFSFQGIAQMKQEKSDIFVMSIQELARYRKALSADKIVVFFQNNQGKMEEKKLSDIFEELDKSQIELLPKLRGEKEKLWAELRGWEKYLESFPTDKEGLKFTRESEDFILSFFQEKIKTDAKKLLDLAQHKNKNSKGFIDLLVETSREIESSRYNLEAFFLFNQKGEKEIDEFSQALKNLLAAKSVREVVRNLEVLNQQTVTLVDLGRNFYSIIPLFEGLKDLYGDSERNGVVDLSLFYTDLPESLKDKIRIKYKERETGSMRTARIQELVGKTRLLETNLNQLGRHISSLEFFAERKKWILSKDQVSSRNNKDAIIHSEEPLFFYTGIKTGLKKIVLEKAKNDAVKIQERQAYDLWRKRHVQKKGVSSK
ncbi:MAG: hypothetical protein CMM87_06220 [Rickettsiales bacterium]|nr:hypothetical protein [Rickettsiales bacterium]|tara:strand:+ start:73381 stop:75564 length:2184 start_codon:yes stop_codon:yes gene_type:complete